MIVMCSSCKKILRAEDGQDPVGVISHSYCPECAELICRELNQPYENSSASHTDSA